MPTVIRRLQAPLLAAALMFSMPVAAEPPEPLPEIDARIDGLAGHVGFMDLYWDDAEGKVLMRIVDLDRAVLYVNALVTGVGSNDIGLDRGQLGRSRVVRFQRAGRQVLMIEDNLDYRAESANADERRAVDEAFAESVLASFPVEASGPDGVLVDVTPLVLADAHGVAARLEALEQGSYDLDAKRSTALPGSLRAFPQNNVIEALVTFSGKKPGDQVASVTPTPEALSIRMMHQFVVLPEPGFQRRPFHPRSGFFEFRYRDYAVPLGQPIDRRVVPRHRLQTDARGQVTEPLVYYVDRGAPEPIRSALIEGASWWADAFEAAGFPDGYRVEVLPEGVDPLDVRYNVIQWVHRSTRGWSYGASVRDPRTGEIIKGHISLGSLRVRQDMLIAEGLLAPFESGAEPGVTIQAMALARLRQLAAHEVGHTLGLAHNFAASVADDASVMDYPHPFVRLDEQGRIRIDDAYDIGIGAWDKLAIEYGYREFDDEGARSRGLAEILDRAESGGLRFISDPNARGFGTAHAVAHLWDNGSDPLLRFDELKRIRRVALDRFGAAVLRSDEPYSDMERKLVPVYLVHRYQAEAVAKLLGGLDYDHRLRGEPDAAVARVGAGRQWQALEALIEAIEPGQLRLSPALIGLLQPPAYGFDRDRETFSHRTAEAFDAWAPARALSQWVAQLLLHPERAARLEQHHALDERSPGLEDLLDRIGDQVIESAVDRREPDPLAEHVAWILLREMQRLAVDPAATDRVRGLVMSRLAGLASSLARKRDAGESMARAIERFLEDPDPARLPPREVVPPGSPI